MHRWTAVALVTLAACYRANGFAPCVVTCALGETCLDNSPCGADGLCHLGVATCTGVDAHGAPDGVVGSDARHLDAGDCKQVVGTLLPFCFDGNESAEVQVDSMLVGCMATVPQMTGPDVCVIFADTIRIDNPLDLRAAGSSGGGAPSPIAFIARYSLIIDAPIAINGAVGDPNGAPDYLYAPGATGCGSVPVASDAGGAGASFGGAGGAGGKGGSTGTPGNLPDPAASGLSALRGGCNGDPNGTPAGAPGGGGLLLASGGPLSITDTIDAGGGGGPGGAPELGGYGGASGGMVVLDAPTMTGSGAIFANGGGGGGGGGPGAPGSQGDNAIGGGLVAGGSPSANAGAGGEGAAQGRGRTAGSAGTLYGGGGGGGGEGLIIVLGRADGSAGLPFTTDPPARTSLP